MSETFIVIPDRVLHLSIRPTSKLLYGVIVRLSKKTGYCWAANTYLATCIGLAGPDSVRRLIIELCKVGVIKVEREPNRHIFPLVLMSNTVPDYTPTVPDYTPTVPDYTPTVPDYTHKNIIGKNTIEDVPKKEQKASRMLSSVLLKWWTCLETLQSVTKFVIPEKPKICFMGIDTSVDETHICTKTLKGVIGYLEQIEKGKFEREIEATTSLLRKMTVIEIEKLLDEQTKRFIRARDNRKVFPLDKTALKELKNIQEFFKPFRRLSWLLWTMQYTDTICDKKEVSELEEKLNIPLDAHRVFREMFGWTSEVMQGLYGVQTRIEDIVQNLDYDMSSPQTETLWKEYVEMFQGWKGTGVAHLKSPKVWNIFEDRVEKTYGVDLHPVPVQEEAPRQAVERTTAEQIEWLRQHDHSPTAYIQIEELEEKLKGERNE